MKKSTCLVIVCLLVSVFAFASSALAIGKKEIINTEWEATGSAKFKDPETKVYLGAMVGGIGILKITETDVEGTFAPMVVSGLYGLGVAEVLAGATAIWTMEDWTKDGDILTSNTGSVVITVPGLGEIVNFSSEEMTMKITFITETSFTGKIKYIGDDGALNVIKLNGKKLGQLPVVPE
mgnify:CR=1 FL=1